MIASCFGGPLCSFVFAVLMLVCAFFVGASFCCVFPHFVLVLGGVWKGGKERLVQGVKESGQEAKPLNRASSNRSLNTAGLKKEIVESVPASS